MDGSHIMLIVVVALFAVIVVAVLWRPWTRFRAAIKGPAGTALEVEASHEQPQAQPGVQMEEVKAGGDATADDGTGRGAVMKKVQAGRHARATSTLPGNHPGPKA